MACGTCQMGKTVHETCPILNVLSSLYFCHCLSFPSFLASIQLEESLVCGYWQKSVVQKIRKRGEKRTLELTGPFILQQSRVRHLKQKGHFTDVFGHRDGLY